MCNGSGFLLDALCPLCDDHVSLTGSVPQVGLSKPETAHDCGCPLCLVLDIDGTLLSEEAPENASAEQLKDFLRPGVHDFLDFAFQNFRGVALWTASCRAWLAVFMHAVDPAGMRKWAFTWSGRITLVAPNLLDSDYLTTDLAFPVRLRRKVLSKIWHNRSLREKGYNCRSTLIVDNTPEVCRSNYGNAIYIKTYGDSDYGEPAIDSSDAHLFVLQHYFKKLIELSLQGVSMRSIEKRCWYAEVRTQL